MRLSESHASDFIHGVSNGEDLTLKHFHLVIGPLENKNISTFFNKIAIYVYEKAGK